MNIEQKERYEYLKKENQEKRRKKEIERNTLFLECMEALGTEGKVLDPKEKAIVYRIFGERIPFLPWGVDWKQLSSSYKIDKLNNIYKKCKCKNFYIIWGNELPIIISDIVSIIRNISEVCAVEFDTWLFSEDYSEVIEFHHDLGITYGIVSKNSDIVV